MKKQVKMGIKAEKVHKLNKKRTLQIVKDHLKEVKNYYTKLKKCGL